MTINNMSRRGLFGFAATGAIAASTFALSTIAARAYQGNMEQALGSLSDALGSLHQATANKGGHRARAIALINDAMREVQAGIDFADEHGGGGAD